MKSTRWWRAGLVVALMLAGHDRALAQSTKTLTIGDFADAKNAGFTFKLATTSGECTSGAGGGNPVATTVYGRVDAGNVGSSCEHQIFQIRPLANGWVVSSVESERSCEQKVASSWQSMPSTNCTFSITQKPAANSPQLAGTVKVTVGGLPHNARKATFRWVLTIKGPADKSPWTWEPPAAATLTAPNAGYIRPQGGHTYLQGLALVSTFSWSQATGATEYLLQLKKNGSWVTVSSANSLQRTALLECGTVVSWRVRACNPGGCANSPERELLVTYPAPGLRSPSNGATTTDSTPQFQWEFLGNPVPSSYEVRVQGNTGSSQTFTTTGGQGVRAMSPASPLNLPSPLIWQVRACNQPTGCGIWSTTRTVTIQ
jgi:hypothetical protein